jgi:hypothetical protein
VNPKLLRLVLAAALFAAWMGYLSYLVYALPRPPKGSDLPIVLSRPQILVSKIDVVGTINIKDGTVKVAQVLYPRDATEPKKDDEVQVTNFDEVRPSLSEQTNLGMCLLPLQTTDDGKTYHVVPLPASPGFHGDAPRIYPATEEILAQYHAIQKP